MKKGDIPGYKTKTLPVQTFMLNEWEESDERIVISIENLQRQYELVHLDAMSEMDWPLLGEFQYTKRH